MKYYEYIDIPDLQQLQTDIWNLLPDAMKDPSVTFLSKDDSVYNDIVNNIHFKDFLEYKGWYKHLANLVVYTMDKDSTFHIHVDGTTDGIARNRLLVPIKGCEGTYTKFFTSDSNPVIDYIHGDTEEPQPFIRYNPEDCKFITQAELSQPYIINHQVPHGIYNPTPKRRTSLWINFYSSLDLLDYVSEFETDRISF